MTGTVALVSLRFNPAFVQHLLAYSKASTELGFRVSFILDPNYRIFPELEAAAPCLNHSCRIGSFAHAVFLNAATKNLELAKQFQAHGAKITYVYHEPWKASLRYLLSDGIRSSLKAAAAHRISIPLLKLADRVVLESQYGLAAYRQFDARWNANASYFPQIYDDETAGDPVDCGSKQYFSYLGNISRVHAFDRFIAIVRMSLQRDLDFKFLVASRSALPASILRDRLIAANPEKVKFLCGQPLSARDMNRCYQQSFCVWNLYRRSTQSGVLPKALMFGTPVLAVRAGSFPEYIKDGINGRFLSPEDFEAIVRALDEIRTNQAKYAERCRRAFLDTFYYRSCLPALRLILD